MNCSVGQYNKKDIISKKKRADPNKHKRDARREGHPKSDRHRRSVERFHVSNHKNANLMKKRIENRTGFFLHQEHWLWIGVVTTDGWKMFHLSFQRVGWVSLEWCEWRDVAWRRSIFRAIKSKSKLKMTAGFYAWDTRRSFITTSTSPRFSFL